MLKVVENLPAIGALPRTSLGSSQRSPDLAGREGLLPPPEEPHPRSRPFVLGPNEKFSGHGPQGPIFDFNGWTCCPQRKAVKNAPHRPALLS